jgi:hypothetical protein
MINQNRQYTRALSLLVLSLQFLLLSFRIKIIVVYLSKLIDSSFCSYNNL